MKDEMLSLPVKATMRLQPDGSWEMVDAVYADVSVYAIAWMLLKSFHVPFTEPDGEE